MRGALLWAAAAVFVSACGADNYGDGNFGYEDGGTNQCFSSNECPTGWSCSEFGTCVPPMQPTVDGGPDSTPLPPEVEREFGPPTSTLRYVYVNMPELDQLEKIDGSTLAVTAVPVGDRPEIVATVPGTDEAVALDRGSATCTIVKPTIDRDDKVTLATLPHLNVLTMEPGGRFAVAWFDLQKAIADAGGIAGVVDEIGSFQDVTVISLASGEERAVNLSVGFRPRKVDFDAAGAHAYVVTEDGVSVIDLAAAATGEAHVAAAVPVVPDPLIDPAALEVEVTSSGAHAISRAPGRPALYVTTLATGDVRTIDLPSEATDVDLLPDGVRVLAVLREAHEVAIIDIPADADDPTGIDWIDLSGLALGGAVGSAAVDQAGDTALLYTNATDLERVAILDLAAADYPVEARALQKGVRALAFAPDGRTALILHSKRPGDPGATTDFDEFIDRSYGYSLMDIDSGFTKLVLTQVDPGDFTFSPDSSHGWLALDGGDSEGALTDVQVMDLETFVVSDVPTGSPPEFLGVLPNAGVVFVSQRHPLGRVTFLDLGTAATHTVTGFELNSHIID